MKTKWKRKDYSFARFFKGVDKFVKKNNGDIVRVNGKKDIPGKVVWVSLKVGTYVKQKHGEL